jgi:hypothetical protein
VPVSRMWALKVTRSTMAATWVGEHGAPFAERQVGGDRDGGSFFAFGDDLEQQFGAAGVDLDVAQLVQAEEIESAVATDYAEQGSFVSGLDELVDQLCGGDVADAAASAAAGSGLVDPRVFNASKRLAAKGSPHPTEAICSPLMRVFGVWPRRGRRGVRGPWTGR